MAGKKRKEWMREKRRKALEGCGKYKYRNITGADLLLSRLPFNGRKMIPSGGEFLGDDWYKRLCPGSLVLVETLQEVPINLPDADQEVQELLPLGETVSAEEQVTVEIREDSPRDRKPLTEELLRELRQNQKFSWSKLAKETEYSLTFVRKKCKQFGIT